MMSRLPNDNSKSEDAVNCLVLLFEPYLPFSSKAPPLKMIREPHVMFCSLELSKSVLNHDGSIFIKVSCIPLFENGV